MTAAEARTHKNAAKNAFLGFLRESKLRGSKVLDISCSFRDVFLCTQPEESFISMDVCQEKVTIIAKIRSRLARGVRCRRARFAGALRLPLHQSSCSLSLYSSRPSYNNYRRSNKLVRCCVECSRDEVYSGFCRKRKRRHTTEQGALMMHTSPRRPATK